MPCYSISIFRIVEAPENARLRLTVTPPAVRAAPNPIGVRLQQPEAVPARAALDQTVAAQLWAVSEEATGVHFDLPAPVAAD